MTYLFATTKIDRYSFIPHKDTNSLQFDFVQFRRFFLFMFKVPMVIKIAEYKSNFGKQIVQCIGRTFMFWTEIASHFNFDILHMAEKIIRCIFSVFYILTWLAASCIGTISACKKHWLDPLMTWNSTYVYNYQLFIFSKMLNTNLFNVIINSKCNFVPPEIHMFDWKQNYKVVNIFEQKKHLSHHSRS